jgi:hypothetical protein
MKVFKIIGLSAIGLIFAGGYYIKYRVDDSKIVKVVSVEPKIEKESKFKYTHLRYIHRDGKADSKSVMVEFEKPLAEIAAKNGCIKLELAFPDWYLYEHRGLTSFEAIECPF